MRIATLSKLMLTIGLAVGAGLGFWLHNAQGLSLIDAPDVAWTTPADPALHNLGSADPVTRERSEDCTQLSYRLIDDLRKTMHSGCFQPTASGMIDTANAVALFNGSDEAEPIRYGGSLAGLSIMPHSGSVGRFGGSSFTGTNLHLFTDFYGSLATGGNVLVGRYKSITGDPQFIVPDTAGQPLAINASALAYAARSQWLVTEVPGNALVRVNLATFSVLPFASSFFTSGRPLATHLAAMAVTEDGRYVAVASQEFSTFKVYDLKNCGVVQSSNALVAQNCASYDYRPFLDRQIGATISTISHLQFVNDGVLSLVVHSGSSVDTYLLGPDGPIKSLIPYLGVGDSFASGQGGFNYLRGTDTADNRCHLSAHSYPLLLSGELFGGRGQSVACSGARMTDIGNLSPKYTGQAVSQRSAQERQADGSEVAILHDYTPGYLAQQRFVGAYQPGVATVQIGGNDIGFGTLLMRCVSPLATVRPPTLNPTNCYSSYEDRRELADLIARKQKDWTLLYRQLQQQSPATRFYAIGYPQLLSDIANCRLNVQLSASEVRFARQVTLQLNRTVQTAAQAAGIPYVDIADALEGRQLCSGASGGLAVNGVTAGNDAYVLGQESFHPNARGHELIALAIRRQTGNFAVLPKQPPTTVEASTVPDDDPLLQAPKSGRPIRAVTPGSSSPVVVRSGSVMKITISAGTAGVQPNTSYQVGDAQSDFGTIRSQPDGSIDTTIALPGLLPGIDIIEVTGPGPGSMPISVPHIVYVITDPTDSDGDGTADDQDPCPLIGGLDPLLCHDSLPLAVVEPLLTSVVSTAPVLTVQAADTVGITVVQAAAASVVHMSRGSAAGIIAVAQPIDTAVLSSAISPTPTTSNRPERSRPCVVLRFWRIWLWSVLLLFMIIVVLFWMRRRRAVGRQRRP